MSVNPLTMTPSGAAGAYSRVQGGITSGAVDDGADGPAASGSSFGSTLQQAMQNVVQSGHDADVKTIEGMSGEGNITDVVMAVSRAQLALQSTVVIRDRVVQAYQDIMKMSI